METQARLEQHNEPGAENPVVTHKESRIVHLKKRIIDVYDWVLGPASTEKDRVDRMVAEALDRIPEYLDA